MADFPLVNLGTLAIKQIHTTLTKFIGNQASSFPFFRTYICMPPAQVYHWIYANVQKGMQELARAKSSEAQRLSEEKAVELGVNILGEFVIFSFVAATVYFKYRRPSNKRSQREEEKQREMSALQESVSDLHLLIEEQAAEIRQLQRTVWDLR